MAAAAALHLFVSSPPCPFVVRWIVRSDRLTDERKVTVEHTSEGQTAKKSGATNVCGGWGARTSGDCIFRARASKRRRHCRRRRFWREEPASSPSKRRNQCVQATTNWLISDW